MLQDKLLSANVLDDPFLVGTVKLMKSVHSFPEIVVFNVDGTHHREVCRDNDDGDGNLLSLQGLNT